jgi:hypothetical protein
MAPQSHDLNPMDYTMWDSLSEKVYAGRTEKFTEQELKDNIQEKWAAISLAELGSPLEHGRRDCDLCVVRMMAIFII